MYEFSHILLCSDEEAYYDLMLDRHVTTVPVLQKILRACGYKLTITPIPTAAPNTPTEPEEVKHGLA